MAKRGGKAANRRERQRRAQRQALQMVQRTPPPPSVDISEVVASTAETRATATTPVSRPATPAARAGRADPRFAVSGPSRLTERAGSEYHYVLRDLRSIGILMAIMAALLAVATIVLGAVRG
jgi:hypothetical protein